MNKKVLVALILCILLPFGTINSPIEIGRYIAPLWINYYTVVGLWAYWGEPFWQAYLACYGIASFGIIMLYCGIGWIQTVFTWLKNRLGIENIKNKNPIIEFHAVLQSLKEGWENNNDKSSLFLLYSRYLGISLKESGILLITLITYGLWPIIAFLKKCFLKLKRKRRRNRSCAKNQNKKPCGKKKNKKRGLARWLGKQSIWVILLFLLIPFPYTDPAATVAMKFKETKHGLWYLLTVNTLHIYLIVWLAYKGIEIVFF